MLAELFSYITGVWYILFVLLFSAALATLISWGAYTLNKRINLYQDTIFSYIVILISTIISLFISRNMIDFIVEYEDSYYGPLIQSTSNLAGKRVEYISKGAKPQSFLKGSKNACILSNGLFSLAPGLTKVVDHLKKLDVDIYVPTLAFSLYNVKRSNQITNQDVVDSLYEDIQYVLSKKYDKIYLIGYSYGCLPLLELSILNEIPKCKIILINPEFWSSWQAKLVMLGLDFVSIFCSYYPNVDIGTFDAKYKNIPFSYSHSIGNLQTGAHVCPLFVGKRSIEMSIEVREKLKNQNDCIRNDFSIINCKNDTTMDYRFRAELLKKQVKHKKVFTLNNHDHQVVIERNDDDFFKALDESLKIL